MHIRTPLLLILFVSTSSVLSAVPEEITEDYVPSKSGLVKLRAGGGIGAKYGGWGGGALECDIGYVALSIGLGVIMPNFNIYSESRDEPSPSRDVQELGWQTGLKLYLGETRKIRTSLVCYLGRVFPYSIDYSYHKSKGLFVGITPGFTVDHDVGTPNGFSFTYGLGAMLHKQIPEEDQMIIEAWRGEGTFIHLSLMVGVNYAIF